MKRSFRHQWILNLLRSDPGLVERSMFGCRAAYSRGRLVAVLADGAPPWNGFLLPTERAHHEGLRARWKRLEPHPVLGKWLWIPETSPDFEETAEELAEEILRGHPMIGVTPQPKKKPSRRITGKSGCRSRGYRAARRKKRPPG